MIGTALKNLAAQYQLGVSNGVAYGYLQGSFVTLSDELFCRRLSIYVGCVNIPLPEGEELPPAAKCSAMIVDMITRGSGDDNVYALLRNRFVPGLVVNHSGSVVTVNFSKNKAGLDGLQRFIAELLPQITPLTAPLQCSHCGGHTGRQGYPVLIAADTAVPMHVECLAKYQKDAKPRCNPIAGIIGAIIGALAGAVLWAVNFHAGYVSALGALCILALTLGGYKLLRGRSGRMQAIVVGVCMIAAVLLGTIGGYAWLLHDQYSAYGSVVTGMMSESVYLRVSAKNLFSDPASLTEMLINLAIGLVFALIGAASALISPQGSAPTESPRALPGKA